MPKRRWLWVATCAICLSGGVALGRYSAAPASRAETALSSRVAAKQVEGRGEVQARAEEATQARSEAQTERVRIVWRERETRADGSVTERAVEASAESARMAQEVEASKREVAQLRQELLELEASAAVEERTITVEVPTLPDWRLSGLAGVDLLDARPAFGASVERRILGPVYVGAWGLSTGAVGVSVGFSW